MTELHDHSAWNELRQLVAKLSMISHAGGVSYETKVIRDTSESIGGRRPPGSDRERPNRKDHDELAAFLASYHRRTVGYFQRQIESCYTLSRLIQLRDEADTTLKAWQRTPIPKGQEPVFGSPQWKRFVAESPLDGGELARRFGVTRQYIHQIRKAYRDAA